MANGRKQQRTWSIDELRLKSRQIRATCVQMAFDAKQGHLNGAMSCVDILVALYYGWLNVAPPLTDNSADPARDRFVFSKGHACKSLYAVLADRGFIPLQWLSGYAQNDSPLPMHPCKHALGILETSAGSLGHGLGMATGMGYALRLDNNPARCVALLSDGECNEGSTWEAAMFAAAHKMDSVLAIVDYNRVQSVGRTDDLTGGTSFEEKFRAFGWAARTVDGHDIAQILATLSEVPFERARPTAIIARTRAGAGVSFMEDQVLWHYRAPSQDDLDRALAELGARPIYTPGHA
jgi:transketolase